MQGIVCHSIHYIWLGSGLPHWWPGLYIATSSMNFSRGVTHRRGRLNSTSYPRRFPWGFPQISAVKGVFRTLQGGGFSLKIEHITIFRVSAKGNSSGGPQALDTDRFRDIEAWTWTTIPTLSLELPSLPIDFMGKSSSSCPFCRERPSSNSSQ